MAQVGLGGHGGTIQYSIEATDAVEMAAVYDIDDAEMQQAADRFRCDTAASYEALLARDDLDAVVLVTPNHLHRAQVEAAFGADLDVLVEKPIANTVADGKAMVAAAEKSGRLLMVGHNMRRNRVCRKTKRLLDEERLGEIVSIEAHFSVNSTPRLTEESWRMRPDQCPLLPVMQLGIHAIDLMHYFFSPIEEVFTFTRSVTTKPEVVDSVAANFRTMDGVHGSLISNYCSQTTFAYRLTGTAATLESNAHRLSLRTTKDTDMHGGGPADVDDYSEYWRESYTRQMEAFGQSVRDRAHPETDGVAGLQALAVVEALQRAAKTHAPQTVPAIHSTQTA